MTIQGSEAVSEMLLATRTCVFDAYGTLFDFHAPVARLASRIGSRALEWSSGKRAGYEPDYQRGLTTSVKKGGGEEGEPHSRSCSYR